MKNCILALLCAIGSPLLAGDWTVIKVAEAEGFVRTHSHVPATGELLLGNGGSLLRQQAFGSRTLLPFALGSLVVDPSFIATSPGGGLLGAGGFGNTGVHSFDPGLPTQTPGAALATLQNFDGAFWRHPVHGTEGWIIGGGNGTLTSGPFGDFKQHNFTFVSPDGATEKVITGDLSTFSSGIAVDNQGTVYFGTSDTNPALNNRVLKFSADVVRGAITGTALDVNDAALVTTLPATGSLAVDSLGRIWAAGFERDVIFMHAGTAGTRLFKPDHPSITGAGGPVLYQVKSFAVGGTPYVSFLASDQFGVGSTPVFYGWKKVDDLASRTVTFATASQTTSESAGSVSIEVRMQPAPTQPVKVPIKLSGTATKGADYNLGSQSVQFLPGQTSKLISLSLRADTLDEAGSSETIIVELDHPTPNSHCGVGLSGNVHTVTVLDVESVLVVASAQSFPTLRVGTNFNHQLVVSGGAAVNYSASGLPKGLKLNPRTGEITGRPETPGEFMLIVKAMNALGSTTSEAILMNVEPMAALLEGQFVALCDAGERLDITVKPNAFFTGSFRVGRTVHKLSGYLDTSTQDGVYSILLPSYGSFSFTIDRNSGDVSGTTLGGSLVGWRAGNASHHDGRHHFRIAAGTAIDQPGGSGYGSIVVDSRGLVTITGRAADNSGFSSACPMSSSGDVIVYQALYANVGHLLAMLNLDNTIDREITGDFVWKKPPQTGSGVYSAGWSSPLVLAVSGGRYRAVAGASLFLGAAPAGSANAEVVLSGAGIPPTNIDFIIAVKPTVRIAEPNSLRLNRATGLVSGKGLAGGELLSFAGIMVPQTGTVSAFDGVVSGFFVRQQKTGLVELRPKP